MINKIVDIKFNEITSDFTIIGELQQTPKSLKICMRRYIEDRKLVTIEPYYFECEVTNNIFTARLNINESLQKLEILEQQILDCYIECDGKEAIIYSLYDDTKFETSYSILKENPLYKVKPYISKRNTISIFINNIDIVAKIKDYNIEDNKLDINIDLNANEYEKTILNHECCFEIVIKNRTDVNLFEYEKLYTQTLETKDNKSLSIRSLDLKKIILNNSNKNNIYWDLFVKCKINKSVVEIPINSNQAFKKIYELYNTLLNVSVETNNKSNVCLNLIAKTLQTNVYCFEQNQTDIKLGIEINNGENNYENITFVCKKRIEVGNSIQYYDVFEKVISKERNEKLNIDVEFSFEEIIPLNQIKENDVYDLYIRVKDKDSSIDIPIKISPELEDIKHDYVVIGKDDVKFRAKAYINASKNISIYTIYNNMNHDYNVKLAVFGSCFSRSAFTSTKFFNPKYKEIFNVVQTDFHTSIISAVSNAVEIDLEKINTLKLRNLSYIENDFNKSFFERLKSSKAEYLILDFYPDAAREIIYFEENKCVSGSLDLRSTQYYKELKDIKILDHSNNDIYFEVWKDSLKKFMDIAKTIIPEENIILTKSNFIEKYKDKDNNIKEFSDQEKIKRNKHLFDKMNNYYIKNYCNSPIIDLRKTPYIGVYNHPLGNTYSHYESEYYKIFMHELERIVLLNLLRNR